LGRSAYAPLVKRLGFLLLAAVACAAVLAARSAGEPPTLLVRFAATHQVPFAGRLFTGLTITSLSTHITQVNCDAKVGDKVLPGRQQRFFAKLVAGPATITCSWQIPAGAKGKLLHLSEQGHAYVFTASGSTLGSPAFSWRIKQ
jgi:hypothetical protein